MSDPTHDGPSIEDLAEEFLARCRSGERPTLEEYARRYPELAGEIREFFPVLGLMEDYKPGSGDVTGSLAGPVVAGVAPPLEQLGDFRLLREVGRGGMGVVYEAEQQSLGRRVALKVLRDQRLNDPKTMIRFHREAKAAARLHHTNIVPVFGVGEHNGVHFYVMQFIRGLPLDAVLDEVRRMRGLKPSGNDCHREIPSSAAAGELTLAGLAQSMAAGKFVVAPPTEVAGNTTSELPVVPGRDRSSVTLLGQPGFSTATDSTRVYAQSVARVGLQVAEALDYAHQQGILHRDIKPSNLLLDASGVVWVTDFGLAKVASDSDLTRTGDVVGTIRYMAPERFSGRCDVRADIYALGLTMYELLARQPAFTAEDRHALIRQVTQDEPHPLRQVEPTIPRDLNTIVHTAIARDPEDRYASAVELRDELERFLADRPIRSRPVSLAERYWRWCKRNPLLAMSTTAACVLLIAVAIVSSAAAYRNGRLASDLKTQRDEANRNLIQAYTNEAEARRHSRRPGQRFESLDAVSRAVKLAKSTGLSEQQRLKLRNQAIAAMGLPDVRIAWQFKSGEIGRRHFTIDPSFERYAYKRDDGTVVVCRIADDRTVLELPGLPHNPVSMALAEFSPDGHYLAIQSRSDHDLLEIWDLSMPHRVLEESNVAGSNVPNWAFHPDCRRLAYGRRSDGLIVVVDLASGHELRHSIKDHADVSSMAFSADGSRLALTANAGSVHVLETDSGRVVAQLDNPAQVYHLAWNPRFPSLLAAGVEDNSVRIWDVDTGRLTVSLEAEGDNGLMVAFHPGGDLLAVRGWNGVLRIWDIRIKQQILSMPSGSIPELRFSRDGSQLSAHATAGQAGILEIAYETECRSLVREPGPLSHHHTALAIDNSGHHLLTACATGMILWDLPTGTQMAVLPVTPTTRHVHFDADGSILTSSPMTLRWPIAARPGGATVGPPQLLQWYQTSDSSSLSRDGRVVALAIFNGGGLVFDTEKPADRRLIVPHLDTRGIHLSGDGRWLITKSHGLRTVRLWDAHTGRLIRDLTETDHYTDALFSPDCRWLAGYVPMRGWEMMETESWTTRIRLLSTPGAITFSPDSAVFAYETYANSYQGSVALVELGTGKELARFDDPDAMDASQIVFSPDGMQLIISMRAQPKVRIWDLRAIRRRLARLDLDWGPPLTPDAAVSPPLPFHLPKPPKYRVDRGGLDQWMKQAPIKRREVAVADADALLRREPDRVEFRKWLAELCNSLAWELVARQEANRDPVRAVALARRAVALAPENAANFNTLGLALYRHGRYTEAIPTLERSLQANSSSVPYNLFFLALCHARRGEAVPAWAYYDRARSWLKANVTVSRLVDQELKTFQAEAEAVLHGMNNELPDDVFAKFVRPD